MSVWLRRRAAVAAEERTEAEARQAALRQAEEQALAERPDAALLAEAGLKDPAELISAEEIRHFLKHALPDRLKRRALRRLWGLNPVLANVDGLVDYGEDFTDKALCVENMQTLYTVGKGMLEQFKGLEEEPDVAEASADVDGVAFAADVDDEAPDQAQDGGEEMAEVEAPEELPDQVRDGGAAEVALHDDDPAEVPVSGQRRMRFTFERV